MRACIPLRFVGVPSATRNSLYHERHQYRGADPGGERTGETGEDVLQTGRVQAGKPGDVERWSQFLKVIPKLLLLFKFLILLNYYF